MKSKFLYQDVDVVSLADKYTVNLLLVLFVVYQFPPFSSVPPMTKLRTNEYKYTVTFTIDYIYLKLIFYFVND